MKVTLDTAATRRHIAGRVRHAMRLRQSGVDTTARALEISPEYLAAILDGRTPLSAYVAVRLERHFGLDAHRLLVDQTLEELAAARQELGAKP